MEEIVGRTEKVYGFSRYFQYWYNGIN